MSDCVQSQTSLFGISTVTGHYVIGRVPMRPGINLYACRLRSISTTRYNVVAPVIPTIGESVTANLGPFGTLSGKVEQNTEDGFVVAISAGATRQEALASQISEFRNRSWSGVRERRGDRRFLAHEPRSMMARPDGWAQPCLIIDYSASGVAISAGYQPEVGEVVTIGKITGSVVRIFDAGFAVHFFERQDAASVESLLGAPQEWREAARLSATGPYDPVQPVLVGTET